MRYRLRTLLILLGVAPPVIGLGVLWSGRIARLWEVNDPVLIIGLVGWLVIFTKFVLLRPPAPPG